MSRIYDTLDCGCLISCDGGGGLYPCNTHWDRFPKEGDPLYKYFRQHKMLEGYCRICHPNDYKITKENTKRKK